MTNCHMSAAGVTGAPIQARTTAPSMDAGTLKHGWRLSVSAKTALRSET
jgi:hypothetical protein